MPANIAKKATRLPPATQAQKDKAVKLYGEGMSLQGICKAANLTRASIYRALEESKTPLRGRGYPGHGTVPEKADEPSLAAQGAPAAARSRKRKASNEVKGRLRDALALNVRLKAMIVDMMLEKTR